MSVSEGRAEMKFQPSRLLGRVFRTVKAPLLQAFEFTGGQWGVALAQWDATSVSEDVAEVNITHFSFLAFCESFFATIT